MKSIDPRVNRLEIPKEHEPTSDGNHGITWEVFHQKKRGTQHVHVGIVHAPNPELALVFAKEQYARRQKTSNLWVAKSADVFSFAYEDEDMFDSATSEEKMYRDPKGFAVRDRITAFRKKENLV